MARSGANERTDDRIDPTDRVVDGAADRGALTDIETELAALTRALDGLSRRSKVYERLDRSGYLLARTLDGRGPTTISALAIELNLDATTVTRQVAAMDADGLVQRSRDPRDARACLVELTAEGRLRMRDVRAAREDRIAGLVDGWSDGDRRTFAAMLARFNEAIRTDRAARAAADGRAN
jgi:DNA-binding MarR family transcriptional regulator